MRANTGGHADEAWRHHLVVGAGQFRLIFNRGLTGAVIASRILVTSHLGEEEAGLATLRADHGCVGDDEQDMLGHALLLRIVSRRRHAVDTATEDAATRRFERRQNP